MPSGAGPHRLIADRYALESVLDQRGSGVVWRARDRASNRVVAVEELRPPPGLALTELAGLAARMRRDVEAAARLDHAGAAGVLGLVEEAGQPFLVTELAEGTTLRELVGRHGPLPARRAAQIGLELLAVLDAARRLGVVHGGIDAGRVLVGPDGAARLTGFGAPTLTGTGGAPGGPAAPVLAPERAQGGPAEAAGDVWSVGAVMHYAVTGLPPAGDQGRAALVAEEPAAPAGWLAPVLAVLLAASPTARPPAAEAHALLGEALRSSQLTPTGAREAPRPAALPTAEPAAPGPATAPWEPWPAGATAATSAGATAAGTGAAWGGAGAGAMGAGAMGAAAAWGAGPAGAAGAATAGTGAAWGAGAGTATVGVGEPWAAGTAMVALAAGPGALDGVGAGPAGTELLARPAEVGAGMAPAGTGDPWAPRPKGAGRRIRRGPPPGLRKGLVVGALSVALAALAFFGSVRLLGGPAETKRRAPLPTLSALASADDPVPPTGPPLTVAPTVPSTTAAPTSTTSVPTTTTPTTTAVPATVSLEAEAGGNSLGGGARVVECGRCSGNAKVGFVGNGGTLQFNGVTVPALGAYRLTISYATGEVRFATLSVNGSAGVPIRFLSSGGFDRVRRLTVVLTLRAGGNTLTFANDQGPAPDFDRIRVRPA